jgi:hypothetical protein
MQISLRSQLVAGTAAIVGASAIAMTPVMGAQLSLPSVQVPSAAAVTLTGLDSPISELLATLQLGNQYLLDTTQLVVNPLSWPFAGFTGGQGFPGALTLPEFGGYSSVGLLPQIIDDALPIVRQLGINGSDYLNVTVAALSGAGIALSEGVWNAAGALLTLDIPGALADLAAGISADHKAVCNVCVRIVASKYEASVAALTQLAPNPLFTLHSIDLQAVHRT